MSDPDLNEAIASASATASTLAQPDTPSLVTIDDLKDMGDKIVKDLLATAAANIFTPANIPAAELEVIQADVKPLLASKTLAMIAVAVLSLVAVQLGLPKIAPADQAALIDGLLKVSTYASLAFAALFRVTAKSSLI